MKGISYFGTFLLHRLPNIATIREGVVIPPPCPIPSFERDYRQNPMSPNMSFLSSAYRWVFWLCLISTLVVVATIIIISLFYIDINLNGLYILLLLIIEGFGWLYVTLHAATNTPDSALKDSIDALSKLQTKH